jgi:crotonobetainyl-CoA:carnitine CoA-transferase CaiB-like acyl-CoA transferase
VAARGMIAEGPDRAGGTRQVIQSPYRFSDADCGAAGHAPHRGEHNRSVLQQWLSASEEEIAALERAGVLVADPER